MTRRLLGIDPGLTGAIAAMDHNGTLDDVMDMPTLLIGKGGGSVKRQVDAASLATYLQWATRDETPGDVLVVIEKVAAMPRQGSSSTFSLGDTAGCIRGVVAALRLPICYVTPAQWKKHFGLGTDKEEARARATLMYPGADLTRKKDHNRAEAILLARYGLETML